MARGKLYTLLFATCMAGYIWLVFSYHRNTANHSDFGVCMFKQVTNIPCPSCGSTRAVLAMVHGDVLGSLTWNPFGVIILLILTLSPLWIVFDMVTRKATLWQAYHRGELILKQRWFAIPAVLLVLLNWGWNIYKGL